MLWMETTSQDQANERYSRMWGTTFTQTADALVGKVNGEGLYEGEQFWADAIKDVRGDPAARLAMAQKHLPLPAAFREAAIALRAIIRTKRKAGEAIEIELRKLHRMAAITSLANYDALEITSFGTIKALDLRPEVVGWNELPLLNKTDAALMTEMWPATHAHTTAARLYPNIAKAAARALAIQRDRLFERSMAEVDRVFGLPVAREERSKPKGFFARLFGR